MLGAGIILVIYMVLFFGVIALSIIEFNKKTKVRDLAAVFHGHAVIWQGHKVIYDGYLKECTYLYGMKIHRLIPMRNYEGFNELIVYVE